MTKAVLTIQSQIYQILVDEISAGVYAPGQRLQESENAAKFNVSRSPVREAFRQLISDGLLSGIPNKGVYIASFTKQDINEIFEMRVLLENYAIAQLHYDLFDEQSADFDRIISEMNHACSDHNVEQYKQLDAEFHQKIVNCCGNRLLQSTYLKIRTLVQQFISHALKTHSRMRGSEVEHEAILEYLRCGNLTAAAEENRAHLDMTREAIISRLYGNSESL